MKNIKEYSEGFKTKLGLFILGCDSVEEMELWDLETYGEMDAFYSNDLASIVLRLIVADGVVNEKEVQYIDDIFGFGYNKEELQSICESHTERVESVLDEELENGYMLIKKVNEKLALAYKELVFMICDIVIESDGIISIAEYQMAKKLKEMAKNTVDN